MGEIMFSITGLEFAYSQAPTSMKSVLQACWLLTTAFGNLIVVIVESIEPFHDQVRLESHSNFSLIQLQNLICLNKRFLSVEHLLLICWAHVTRYGCVFINGSTI